MIRNIIFIFIFLIILNLIWTIFSLDSAPLIKWSSEILTSSTDKWALRGQIGDIMSGHFSALAFLAVALSIIFQYEANKQMRESIDKQALALDLQAKSIEQQNKALEVQSKALEAQIEELKASREESEKQTEEFFIQNMNVKLDRYYSLLTKLINNCDEDIATKYFQRETAISNTLSTHNFSSIEELNASTREDIKRIIYENSLQLDKYQHKISSILQTIKLIYEEISNIRTLYNSSYKQFLSELALRIQSERVFYNIYETPLESMELSEKEVKPLELLDTPLEQFIANIERS